MVAGHLSHRSF